MDSALVAVVTSLAEVWIETVKDLVKLLSVSVTSLAEVWIETIKTSFNVGDLVRHFPCGSVD